MGIIQIFYDSSTNMHLESFYISSNTATFKFRRPDNTPITLSKVITATILYLNN